VHIYSNMETSAVYNFTENDFTPTITLSGTVNATVNGQPADYVRVHAFLGADYNNFDNYTGAYTEVDLDDGTWTMRIPPFTADTTLYFVLEIDGGGAYAIKVAGETATVKDQNISGIDLGNIGFSTITLSGTATVTVNGDAPWETNVRVYTDAQFQNYIAETWFDGTDWSLTIPSFDTDTPLYFTVYAYGNGGGGEKYTGVTRTVRAADVSGINLGTIDIQDITLSGTITVTVNGQEPDDAWLIVYRYYEEDDYMSQIAWLSIDLASNTWSMTLSPSPRDMVLRFEVESYLPGSSNSLRKELSASVTVKDQDKININLGTVNLTTVTLSGTVTITIDGEPYDDYVELTAYSTNGFVFGTPIYPDDDYTWSATLMPFAADTTLSFSVSFYTPWGWVERETNVTKTVKDQNISNIDIVYDFPLPSLITLGGTVTATVNGEVPQGDVYVRAYNHNIGTVFDTLVDLQNNTWSAELLPFSANTRLYFDVLFSINWEYVDTGISVIVRDQSNTNINLGAVNVNYFTLSIDAQIWRVGNTVTLTAPTIWQTVTAQSWQLSSNGNNGWTDITAPATADISYNGKYLRYYAITSDGETLYSNTVRILVLSATEQAVIIDMWDEYGDGWDGNGALRITVNGNQTATNVKVHNTAAENNPSGQRYANTYAFSVNTGDTVALYWVEGSNQHENSFIAYYIDTPPDPAFNNSSWNGVNALVYRLSYTMDNISNGELLGSFTVP